MALSRLVKVLLLAALAIVAVTQEDNIADEVVECPADDPRGLFAHDLFCDVYWDCRAGKTGLGTFTQCPNGLVFSPARYENINLSEPCDYPINVNCSGYELYQEPLGTGPCIYMNGVFLHDDPEVCDQYYICESNSAKIQQCPPGTRFDEKELVCTAPKASDTRNCKNKKTTVDGFSCDPSKEYFTPGGQKLAHPRFADLDDCRKFYYCLDGEHPRKGACDEGLVFSDDTKSCQDPSTVPDCADYYLEE